MMRHLLKLVRRHGWTTLVLGAFFGLTACEDIPNTSRTPGAAAPLSRSAESLRLEQYYTGVQARLQAQGLLRVDGGGADAPFTARTLAEDFERIALFDEYTIRGGQFVAQQTASALRRWQEPIRIGLVFGKLVDEKNRAKDRANVTSYARRLARLTGLDIRVTDNNPNFHVLFLHKDEQKTIGPELQRRMPGISPIVIKEIGNSPRNTFCVAYAFSEQSSLYTYKSAIILVKAEHGDLMRLSCIHEEMAQALGLANDNPNVRPSIFNDDEEFALLTRHDELLLRMLYDRRLKPGMTAQTARPLLPRIASDAIGGS